MVGFDRNANYEARWVLKKRLLIVKINQKICASHPVLWIRIQGSDAFLPPWTGSRIFLTITKTKT
jgi:hypothetical protein